MRSYRCGSCHVRTRSASTSAPGASLSVPRTSSFRRSAAAGVSGLRREEVAMLAGVSTDYYVRLEQGRDQHPSAQVLDALARALQLDDDATAHLHRLAAPPAPPAARSPRPERVPAGIVRLIASWSHTPAYVYGRYMDVLAANPLATAVAPYHAPGRTLSAPRSSTHASATCTATGNESPPAPSPGYARLVGPDVDDPRLNELVGELSVRSERFRQLWAATTPGPSAAAQPARPPSGRPARAQLREAADPRHQLPDARHLPRRARQPKRPSTHPSGDHRHR